MGQFFTFSTHFSALSLTATIVIGGRQPQDSLSIMIGGDLRFTRSDYRKKPATGRILVGKTQMRLKLNKLMVAR
jgi:hypothetical protein